MLMPRGVGAVNTNPLRIKLQFQSDLEANLSPAFPDENQVYQKHQKIHRTSFPLHGDLQTPLLRGVLHVWSPEPKSMQTVTSAKPGAEIAA